MVLRLADVAPGAGLMRVAGLLAGVLAATRAGCSCPGGAVARGAVRPGLLALRSASGLGRVACPDSAQSRS